MTTGEQWKAAMLEKSWGMNPPTGARLAEAPNPYGAPRIHTAMPEPDPTVLERVEWAA